MTRHEFQLDPISLSRYTEQQLVDILKSITEDADFRTDDNSVELASKVVLYSDAQTVVIELLSRVEALYENAKIEAESETAVRTKQHREEWEMEHPHSNKYPAATYFDKLALHDTKTMWAEVNELHIMVKRYRNFRQNYETKINACKKLLSALELINY